MGLRHVTAVLIWLALLATPALAQKKYAFVVGIDRYDNLAPDKQLQKAVGDAKAISEVLAGMGFAVVTLPNVTRPTFNDNWQSFLERIQPGDSAAFIFSGHGVEINGANYLLPRDVPRLRLGRDEQLKRESLALAEILADLRERRPGFSLIVLDACRDNPFAEGTKAIGGTKGLARVEPPDGTFIMYSAGAHQTALDRLSEADKVPTSVYTRTLVPLLKTPGLSLLDMADRLGEQVRDLAASISHRQTPAFYSGVIGGRRVCLAGCEVAVVVQPPAPQPSFNATAEAARICREIEGVSSLSMLAVLERQHKGTPAADCVAARIDELKKAQAAQEATAKADTDRQKLAMAQQQEAERVAREATAKAAEAAAKRKALEEAATRAAMEEKAKREAESAAGKAAADAARTELTRKLQSELKRVGCYSGAIDGVWGTIARRALTQFAQQTKFALSSDEPNEGALKALVDRKAPVCGVKCGSSEQEVNGKCVAKPKTILQEPTVKTAPTAPSASIFGPRTCQTFGNWRMYDTCRTKDGKMCEVTSFDRGRTELTCSDGSKISAKP